MGFSGIWRGRQFNHPVDMYDIDYEEPAATIQALHAQGKIVICYMVDGYQNNSGFPLTYNDQIVLTRGWHSRPTNGIYLWV